jgi:hypothetical protein
MSTDKRIEDSPPPFPPPENREGGVILLVFDPGRRLAGSPVPWAILISSLQDCRLVVGVHLRLVSSASSS